MGPGMLTISHEHQGTASAKETGVWARQGVCVCVDGNQNGFLFIFLLVCFIIIAD